MGREEDEKMRERAQQAEAAQKQLEQQVDGASVDELIEKDPGSRD